MRKLEVIMPVTPVKSPTPPVTFHTTVPWTRPLIGEGTLTPFPIVTKDLKFLKESRYEIYNPCSLWRWVPKVIFPASSKVPSEFWVMTLEKVAINKKMIERMIPWAPGSLAKLISTPSSLLMTVLNVSLWALPVARTVFEVGPGFVVPEKRRT